MKIAYKCEGVTVNFFQVLFTAYYAASKDSIKVNSVLTTCNNLPFCIFFILRHFQVELCRQPGAVMGGAQPDHHGRTGGEYWHRPHPLPLLPHTHRTGKSKDDRVLVKAQIRIRNSCALRVELGVSCASEI